jgi:hypothetical protein
MEKQVSLGVPMCWGVGLVGEASRIFSGDSEASILLRSVTNVEN